MAKDLSFLHADSEDSYQTGHAPRFKIKIYLFGVGNRLTCFLLRLKKFFGLFSIFFFLGMFV